MAWVFPWQSIMGNRHRGRIIPSRGLVHNIHFETNNYEPYSPVLAWTHTIPSGQTAGDNRVNVYRDGVKEIQITEWSKTPVAGIRPGAIIQYDLEPMTPLEASYVDSSRAFAIRPLGDRAKLTWTECAADDLDAYKVYWDAGLGVTPATLLATIYGRENTTYISPQLTNGTTYQFALALVDNVGNASAIGTVYSITADTHPLALTGATVSYSTATRKATLTAAHPANQHSDVAGVCLYDNWIPGIETPDEYVNVDYCWRKQFSTVVTGGSTVTFTTPVLWVGQHKYAMRAIDKYGNQSSYSVLTLNLALVGTTLTRGSIEPLTPINITAYATASAGIIVGWDHAGANTTAFKIYQGGTVLATSTANLTTTPHSKTISALTNGTQYTIYLTAANGGLESPSSDTATATADSSAPACARALTLALVK